MKRKNSRLADVLISIALTILIMVALLLTSMSEPCPNCGHPLAVEDGHYTCDDCGYRS